MKQSTIPILTIPALIGLLAVTACTGPVAEAVVGRSQLVAQVAGEQGETVTNTISVSGTGRITGVPDTLVIDLGISILGDSVAQATSEAAALADKVIKALTGNGVAEADIQTANYSIYPEYDYTGETQNLVGYRVTNTVSARIHQVESAGRVIDAATTAGGDAIVVNGVRFAIDDDAELVTAARQAAWEDAEAKARQLAELAGVTLGSAVSISETTSSAPPPIYYDELARTAADSVTPIQPGEQEVAVVVTVSFAIG